MIVSEKSLQNVTIKMVAQQAKVSVGTVSKVLNAGNCKPEVAARVHTAIRTLGYRPNPYARAVRSMRARCLGILVNSSAQNNNLWLHDLLLGLFEAVSSNNYQSHVQFVPDQASTNNFNGLPQRVDGVILVGFTNSELFASASESFQVPIASYWDRCPIKNHVLIEVEYCKALQQLLEHLLSLGHCRMTAIAGQNPSDQEKVERLKELAAGLHTNFHIDVIFSNLIQDNSQQGFDLTDHALDLYPENTVLFYAADVLAFGGLSCLSRRGKRYPEDISVVGFDNTTWSRSVIPALTEVGFDFHELAHVLVRRLISRIEKENVENEFDRRPVSLRLERRDSTGPVPSMTSQLN